jgi:S-(hydroxymethyl)glutathione dehydrogenase / alcohol dehydrogenase
MKFMAAVLRALNEPLSIEPLYTEESLSVGQVLVQVQCSGICGAQLGEITGVKGPDKYLPHLLGHEGSGIVRKIGPGVKHVREQDHVVMHWRKGVGIEADPPTYCDAGGQKVGGGWVTTFNEYAVVSENRLTRIPKQTPKHIAALMGCALTTALGVINNDAQVKFGQSVAVIGCGGVGLNIVQAAAMASAFPIVGVDILPVKREMAVKFGAKAACQDFTDIREMFPRGVDVIIETTGRPELVEQAYHHTAPGGKTVLVGQMRHDASAAIQTLPMHTGKTLFASEGGQTNPTVDIPRYLRLWESGRLNLDGLITDVVRLADINAALDKIRSGQVGRCIVEMGE